MTNRRLSRDFNEISNDFRNSSLTADTIFAIYDEISPILSPRHQNYLVSLGQGDIDPDPLVHMEIFAHLTTIYGFHVVKWSLESGHVTKDIGSVLGEVRQGNMAVEAMRLKRKENDEDDESGVGGLPSKSAFHILEGLD